MTHVEEQCGWERGGGCRGCLNRKRGDTTHPSGVTEADRAGMRLNYPCGIWLRRRGVLSSFPRQREEASGAGFTVCVLFYQIGPNSSSKHCGLGREAFQTFPGSFSVAPSAARGERASERLPGLAGVGDGAWAGATHPKAVATALPGAVEPEELARGAGLCLLLCVHFPLRSTKPVCSG